MSHAVYVRPIYTDADLDAALARLDEVFHAAPGTPEGDEAEVLGRLVQAYEREHFPLGPPDPVEAIRFHLDRLGLGQADLIPLIGTGEDVEAVLDRRRALTVDMIRRLHERLGVPVESLVGV